jgi:hypothetical protein
MGFADEKDYSYIVVSGRILSVLLCSENWVAGLYSRR